MGTAVIFQGNREGLESVTGMDLGKLLEQQRFAHLAMWGVFNSAVLSVPK